MILGEPVGQRSQNVIC